VEIHRSDAADFLRRLTEAAGVGRSEAETLFYYFVATDGAGASECFVRDEGGAVRMVDPLRGMFDFVHADWRAQRAVRSRAWSWGWAKESSQNSELHLFDDQLSDEQIMGTDHSVAWRREVFGKVEIAYPD
jgi:hypothetical protein